MRNKLCYVRSALGKKITVICNNQKKSKFLCSIGGRRRFFVRSEWVILCDSDELVAQVFGKLRDEEFNFSYDQHGWGPSDLFRYYREKGILTGKFTEIFWLGEGRYRLIRG